MDFGAKIKHQRSLRFPSSSPRAVARDGSRLGKNRLRKIDLLFLRAQKSPSFLTERSQPGVFFTDHCLVGKVLAREATKSPEIRSYVLTERVSKTETHEKAAKTYSQPGSHCPVFHVSRLSQEASIGPLYNGAQFWSRVCQFETLSISGVQSARSLVSFFTSLTKNTSPPTVQKTS